MAYMSQKGYDEMVAQLQQLETVERPKASAAIAEARDKGDLSENAEYDAAKEAQAHLETKINQLKLAIAEAKVIDTSRLSTEAVQILSTVERPTWPTTRRCATPSSARTRPTSRWAKSPSRLRSRKACSTRRSAMWWKLPFRVVRSSCA